MHITMNFEVFGSTNEALYIDLINNIADRIESIDIYSVSPCVKQRIYQYARTRFNPDYVSENFDEMLGEDND